MPHAVVNPTSMLLNLWPPATAMGAGLPGKRPIGNPDPSIPDRSLPQQSADPSAMIPHAVRSPTLSSLNLCPPTTSTGALRENLVPSPNCPLSFAPQQKAAPSVLSAQLKSFPAPTVSISEKIGGESAGGVRGPTPSSPHATRDETRRLKDKKNQRFMAGTPKQRRQGDPLEEGRQMVDIARGARPQALARIVWALGGRAAVAANPA